MTTPQTWLASSFNWNQASKMITDNSGVIHLLQLYIYILFSITTPIINLEPRMRVMVLRGMRSRSHETKSSWKRTTSGAREHSVDDDATRIRRSNSQTSPRATPNKEQFTQRQRETFLSDLFDSNIEFIDTIQRTNREDKEETEEPCTFKRSVKMNKKRKSKIVLNEDEFREAYGFVRRNSMNQTKTRILTRQAKVSTHRKLLSDQPLSTTGGGAKVWQGTGSTKPGLTPCEKHIQPFYVSRPCKTMRKQLCFLIDKKWFLRPIMREYPLSKANSVSPLAPYIK